MTDETPLTEESERLLAMAEHWRDDCKTRCAVTARVRDAVHLIEAAAARRAIEGSGVVEAVEATRTLPDDAPNWRTDKANLYAAGWIDRGDAILAVLPRPEEPRVERVRGTDNDCGRCGAPLRTIDPEYEPGGRVCDDCGWDSRDTHHDGEHDYQPGVCGMSCDFTPEAR